MTMTFEQWVRSAPKISARSNARRAFTKEQIIESLHKVRALYGDPVNENKMLKASVEHQEIPSPRTVILQFGSFPAALAAAGISVEGLRRKAAHIPVMWTDDEIVEVIREFVADCKERDVAPSVVEYGLWRERRKAQDPYVDLPSSALIRGRMANWPALIMRVLHG